MTFHLRSTPFSIFSRDSSSSSKTSVSENPSPSVKVGEVAPPIIRFPTKVYISSTRPAESMPQLRVAPPSTIRIFIPIFFNFPTSSERSTLLVSVLITSAIFSSFSTFSAGAAFETAIILIPSPFLKISALTGVLAELSTMILAGFSLFPAAFLAAFLSEDFTVRLGSSERIVPYSYHHCIYLRSEIIHSFKIKLSRDPDLFPILC